MALSVPLLELDPQREAANVSGTGDWTMFIIRTAFWLGIVVLVMPSDPAQQKQLTEAARNGIAQASTLCDRHETACRHASVAWTAFKAKAETAGRMAFNLAMERLAAPAAHPSAPAPAAQQHRPQRRDRPPAVSMARCAMMIWHPVGAAIWRPSPWAAADLESSQTTVGFTGQRQCSDHWLRPSNVLVVTSSR